MSDYVQGGREVVRFLADMARHAARFSPPLEALASRLTLPAE